MRSCQGARRFDYLHAGIHRYRGNSKLCKQRQKWQNSQRARLPPPTYNRDPRGKSVTRSDNDGFGTPTGDVPDILDHESAKRSSSRVELPGSPTPKAIVGLLRKRLDAPQFQQLIRDVMTSASVDEIVASLNEHGVQANRNINKLRELFGHNTFYKARPQYIAALGQLFWERVLSGIREDQRILDLTALIVRDEEQAAAASTARSNDEALRVVLAESEQILDYTRLLQLAALYAEEKNFRFIEAWQRARASSQERGALLAPPEPELSALPQEDQDKVAPLAAKSSAYPEPELLSVPIEERPRLASHVAPTDDGRRPPPLATDAQQFVIPAQSAHGAVELAITTAASLSKEVPSVISQNPSLVLGLCPRCVTGPSACAGWRHSSIMSGRWSMLRATPYFMTTTGWRCGAASAGRAFPRRSATRCTRSMASMS